MNQLKKGKSKMELKKLKDDEIPNLLERFTGIKNLKGIEYDLASLSNYFTEQQDMSLRDFSKLIEIERTKISRALKKKYIIYNEIKKCYEIKDNVLKDSDQQEISLPMSLDTYFVNQNNNNNKQDYSNDIKNIKSQIEFLTNEISFLKDQKNFLYNNTVRNSVLRLPSSSPNYKDFIGSLDKPQKRSFEIYDFVFQYFKYMLKNFDNRLQKDVHNQLFVEYGESLIANSFEIYCNFVNSEETSDFNELKEILINEQRKEKK